jgi:hypothetical protein
MPLQGAVTIHGVRMASLVPIGPVFVLAAFARSVLLVVLQAQPALLALLAIGAPPALQALVRSWATAVRPAHPTRLAGMPRRAALPLVVVVPVREAPASTTRTSTSAIQVDAAAAC